MRLVIYTRQQQSTSFHIKFDYRIVCFIKNKSQYIVILSDLNIHLNTFVIVNTFIYHIDI